MPNAPKAQNKTDGTEATVSTEDIKDIKNIKGSATGSLNIDETPWPDDDDKKVFPKNGHYYYEKRRMIITILTLLLTSLVIGASAVGAAVYCMNSYNRTLTENVTEKVVAELQNEVEESADFSVLNELSGNYIKGLTDIQEMKFYLFNDDGTCINIAPHSEDSEADEEIIEKASLSESVQKKIRNSHTVSPSAAHINADSSYILRGSYFTVKGRGDRRDSYYILVLCPDKNSQSFLIIVAAAAAVAYIILMTVGILIFYSQYRRYVEYYSGFSEVLQNFAKEDFSVKLAVPDYIESDYYTEMIEAANQIALNIELGEERRKQFISNVSHELRTPMTSICGFIDGINDGTIPPEQHKKYLNIIAQETRRLRNMVQSMLSLTRIESGTLRMPREEFNITDTAIRTLLLFERQIEAKNVEVEVNADVAYKINGNQDYLQQVIYNLTENAVKFVNDGGTITLTVKKDDSDDNCIDIAIRNTGEGISPEEMPKIFDRFYKTDRSRSKDKTGLGLGLTICRRIVHLHGGHIEVRSIQGEYTEFTVKLPVDSDKSKEKIL